ncbi:MAG: hypothetical protein AAFQ42_14675 [Pseudomonadota bacterium]
MKSDRMVRLAPDPVSNVLVAIGALASVASIAALNWVVETDLEEPAGNRRKPRAVLRELEKQCHAIAEVLRRLERNLLLFSDAQGSAATPIKFGVHAIQVPSGSMGLHQSIVGELASLFDATARTTAETMALVSDGEIEPPEDVYFAFADVQSRLNTLLVERRSLRTTITASIDIATKLGELVQSMRTSA